MLNISQFPIERTSSTQLNTPCLHCIICFTTWTFTSCKPAMGQLHFLLFPFMAQGHTIPTLDMAKLYASRGVKTTIITTPRYASMIMEAMEKTNYMSYDIGFRVIKFPAAEAGLPEGCESLDQAMAPDLHPKFFNATSMMQEPLEQILQELSPNCLVADMFFPWATDAAAKFNIPRLVFHGISFFSLCAAENMRVYKPFKNVSSDFEPFEIPYLPHRIQLTRMQLPEWDREEIETDFAKLLRKVKESEWKSYGVIVNSFYELEAEYADYYRKVLGRRAWHIGPLLLCNREAEEKARRGRKPTVDEHECLKWLDTKKPNSVIYACFGSMSIFTTTQLHEIAMGLEASGEQFIWVVRKGENEEDDGKWLPEGFEERIKDKNLIVRGWAPQVLILEHEAVGAFVTHCGWNSTLEGVCAGVPMVTWPLFAEQFFNEKLITQVLRIGIAVGSKQWSRVASGVSREDVAKAVERIMEGAEALQMRGRAKALQEMARKAVQEGGSSYNDLSSLIEELSAYNSQSNKKCS